MNVVDADDGSGSSYEILVECEDLVGLETGPQNNRTIIHPNPTFGLVSISNLQNIEAILEVYNAMGKLVMRYIKPVGQVDLTA